MSFERDRETLKVFCCDSIKTATYFSMHKTTFNIQPFKDYSEHKRNKTECCILTCKQENPFGLLTTA